MKYQERLQARNLRVQGLSIKTIATKLSVSKSSVSLWVRDIKLSEANVLALQQNQHSRIAVERRRTSRLANEAVKRDETISYATSEIGQLSVRELWLIGVALYWAEGGKTQRMVRFSNGDPAMIALMMRFFKEICSTPDEKFRGYIHIHHHLNSQKAEQYWSEISGIPVGQFFKTYRKPNISSKSLKSSLPHGVFDIYIVDAKLFDRIKGWTLGICLGAVQ